MGYGEVRPIPAYQAPLYGYEDTFADWERKEKGAYPFQMVSMHYLKRTHSTLDNVSWLNEIFAGEAMISSTDAAALGIAEGDVVQIRSPFGCIVRTASVTERILPGCVGIYHGGWTAWEEEGELDAGAGENVLIGSGAVGQGTSGYNSMMVSVEKYTGSAYVPDGERERRVAFEE